MRRAIGQAFFLLRTGFLICLFACGAVNESRAQGSAVPANSPVPSPEEPSSPKDRLATFKRMSLEELMDQSVTSVSKEPERYAQAPAAVDVITGDDIRRSGAASIPEALRLADNLDVAQQNSHDWNISARGFNTDLGNKLLVLMDGRSVYTPLFSGVLWDAQDYLLEDIDRIEVISGPGGTLWGANAVNGVINITTKSARDTQGLYVEGGGGSFEQGFGALRYGGTISSNVYYRVYAKYFDRSNEVFPDGRGASDSWQQGRTGFRIDSYAYPDSTLTLQGDFYDGSENINTGGNENQGGGNLLGRWSRSFSDDSDMSLQVYYDRTHLDVPKAAALAEPEGIFRDNLDTADVDFQHHLRLAERNNIVWGLGYRFTHDVTEAAPILAFDPPILNQSLFSGFVQDEFRLLHNLFFTAGTKVEHNDYTGFEVEPSARLQWNFATNQMLWAAVSRAVRTPSRIDHDLREPTGIPVAPNLLVGGSNFDSETVLVYELGYRAQLFEKFSASVSTYYNDYDNLRSATRSAPPAVAGLPIFFENNLEGHTYGGEISLNYQLSESWRLHGGYQLLMEDIHVKPGGVDINNALNETEDPKNQFSLRSSIDLPQNIEFDTGLRWVGRLIANNDGTPLSVPSYFELEARIGWHPRKNLEFAIVGQNLLHDRHVEYFNSTPTQEAIQRSIYGKVSCRF